MSKRKWIGVAILLCVVAIASYAAPFTLGYMFDSTQPVVNFFLPPDIPDTPQVSFLVEKTVVCTNGGAVSPQGYTFLLQSTETGDVVTAVSNRFGAARFTLEYTEADAGKTFTYLLTEQNDGVPYITYSTEQYTVVVNVVRGTDGKVTASYTINGQEVTVAKFTNYFDVTAPGAEEAPPPPTGDVTPLLLLAMLAGMSALGLVLLLRKEQNA